MSSSPCEWSGNSCSWGKKMTPTNTYKNNTKYPAVRYGAVGDNQRPPSGRWDPPETQRILGRQAVSCPTDCRPGSFVARADGELETVAGATAPPPPPQDHPFTLDSPCDGVSSKEHATTSDINRAPCESAYFGLGGLTWDQISARVGHLSFWPIGTSFLHSPPITNPP